MGEWALSDRGFNDQLVQSKTKKVWRMALGSLITTLPVLGLSTTARGHCGEATTVQCSGGETVVPAGLILKFCTSLLVDPLV